MNKYEYLLRKRNKTNLKENFWLSCTGNKLPESNYQNYGVFHVMIDQVRSLNDKNLGYEYAMLLYFNNHPSNIVTKNKGIMTELSLTMLDFDILKTVY